MSYILSFIFVNLIANSSFETGMRVSGDNIGSHPEYVQQRLRTCSSVEGVSTNIIYIMQTLADPPQPWTEVLQQRYEREMDRLVRRTTRTGNTAFESLCPIVQMATDRQAVARFRQNYPEIDINTSPVCSSSLLARDPIDGVVEFLNPSRNSVWERLSKLNHCIRTFRSLYRHRFPSSESLSHDGRTRLIGELQRGSGIVRLDSSTQQPNVSCARSDGSVEIPDAVLCALRQNGIYRQNQKNEQVGGRPHHFSLGVATLREQIDERVDDPDLGSSIEDRMVPAGGVAQ